MLATINITSHAQRGTVFFKVRGPHYCQESDVCYMSLNVAARDRINDKIESEVDVLISAESALALSDALRSLACAARDERSKALSILRPILAELCATNDERNKESGK